MKTKVNKNNSFSIRNAFVSLVKYLVIVFAFFFVGNIVNAEKVNAGWEWVDSSDTRDGDTITFDYNYFNFTLNHTTSGLNSSCYMTYTIGSYTTGEFNSSSCNNYKNTQVRVYVSSDDDQELNSIKVNTNSGGLVILDVPMKAIANGTSGTVLKMVAKDWWRSASTKNVTLKRSSDMQDATAPANYVSRYPAGGSTASNGYNSFQNGDTIYVRNTDVLKFTISDLCDRRGSCDSGVVPGAYMKFTKIDGADPVEAGYFTVDRQNTMKSVTENSVIYTITMTTSTFNGEFKIKISGVKDYLGNAQADHIYNIVVDNTSPTVTFTGGTSANDKDGVRYLKSSTTVSIKFADSSSGLASYSSTSYKYCFSTTNSSTNCTWNAINATTTKAEVKGNLTLPTTEGLYYLFFNVSTVKDAVGNSRSVASPYKMIYIDNTAPTITVALKNTLAVATNSGYKYFSASGGTHYASNGQFVAKSTNYLVVNYSDNAYVKSNYMAYSWCLNPGSDGACKTSTSITSNGYEIPLSSTPYGSDETTLDYLRIDPSVTDYAGNSASINTITKPAETTSSRYAWYYVVIDDTAPVISMSVVGNTAAMSGYTNTRTLTATVTASDVSSCLYARGYKDNTTVILGAIYDTGCDNQTYTDTIQIGSDLGSHPVTVTVVDSAGNYATKQYSIIYDNVAPVISTFTVSSSNSEAQAGYTNKTSVKYSISITESYVRTYEIKDGESVINSSSSKPSTGTLANENNGDHIIKLTLSDKAGNTVAVKQTSITLDTVAPVVTITQDRVFWSQDKTVTITASDERSGVYSSSIKYYLTTNASGHGSSYTSTTSSIPSSVLSTCTLSSNVCTLTYTGKTGTYYIFAERIRDKAGNYSVYEYSTKMYITETYEDPPVYIPGTGVDCTLNPLDPSCGLVVPDTPVIGDTNCLLNPDAYGCGGSGDIIFDPTTPTVPSIGGNTCATNPILCGGMVTPGIGSGGGIVTPVQPGYGGGSILGGLSYLEDEEDDGHINIPAGTTTTLKGTYYFIRSEEILMDNTPPSVTGATIDNSSYEDWVNRDVTIKFTGFTDAHSGVYNFEYTLSDGTTQTTYFSSNVFSTDIDTILTLTKVCDAAGNCSDVTGLSTMIRIDKTNPSIDKLFPHACNGYCGDDGYFNGYYFTKDRELDLDITVSDPVVNGASSGVEFYLLSVDGVAQGSISTTKPTTALLPDEKGEHIVKLTIADAANNSVSLERKIYYDPIAPEITGYIIQSGTTGVDGNKYIVGDRMNVSITWKEEFVHIVDANVPFTISSGDFVGTESYKGTVINLDISSFDIDFENGHTITFALVDYACNVTRIGIEFYRIDGSRDIVFNSFNVRGYNSLLDNYIGPMNVAGGLVAPVYTLKSTTYLDTTRGWFGVGLEGDVTFASTYVPSGTYKNHSNIASWYALQKEGSSSAYLFLYNIYGRMTSYTKTIIFDYTAPRLVTKNLSTTNKTVTFEYTDNYYIQTAQSKIGSYYSYYITEPGRTPSRYAWLYANGDEKDTYVYANLPSVSSELYVKVLGEELNESSALAFDAAGNKAAPGVVYHYTITMPEESNGQVGSQTTIDESKIEAIEPEEDQLSMINAEDRVLTITIDRADPIISSNKITIDTLNQLLAPAEYKVVAINDDLNYEFTAASSVFEKILVTQVKDDNTSSENELIDLVVVVIGPQLSQRSATAGVSNYTQGEELGNVGVSFIEEDDLTIERLITLDGVRVREIDTNKTGVYEVRTIARDDMGRETRVDQTIIVEAREELIEPVLVEEVVPQNKVVENANNEVQEGNSNRKVVENVEMDVRLEGKAEVGTYKSIKQVRNEKLNNWIFKLFSKWFFKVYDG